MSPGRAPSKRRSAPGAGASSGPAFAEKDIDHYVEVPDLIGGQEGDYVLQLAGESMRSAGFLSGDYLVVRPTEEPDAGMIVVVALGGEVTLMRAERDGEELRLRPGEEAMEPTAIGEASVLGRVVGVIRKV